LILPPLDALLYLWKHPNNLNRRNDHDSPPGSKLASVSGESYDALFRRLDVRPQYAREDEALRLEGSLPLTTTIWR